LSLNLYTYCHNNPIKYYDPTGHNAVMAAGMAAGSAAAAAAVAAGRAMGLSGSALGAFMNGQAAGISNAANNAAGAVRDGGGGLEFSPVTMTSSWSSAGDITTTANFSDGSSAHTSNGVTLVKSTGIWNAAGNFVHMAALGGAQTAPFGLNAGAGNTNLKSAESQYIMRMQIRLQSLNHLNRGFTAYGKLGLETMRAVDKFLISEGLLQIPRNHSAALPITTTVNESIWSALGLGSRPDVAGSQLGSMPINADAIALARKELDIAYDEITYTHRFLNSTDSWRSKSRTYTSTYAENLRKALNRQERSEILFRGADLLVAVVQSETIVDLIGNLLNPQPGASDLLNSLFGNSLRNSVNVAGQRLDAIDASHLRFVSNRQGLIGPSYTTTHMTTDAFRAIDRIMRSDNTLQTRNESRAYVEYVIGLMYDKDARNTYENSILNK
jgi:hypothetical protein